MKANECQIHCLPHVAEGNLGVEHRSLKWRVKLLLKRTLSHKTKRNLKKQYARFMDRVAGRTRSAAPVSRPTPLNLKAGDLVRIRTREEIEATLDAWRELRGCGFMKEMWPFCGSTRRVLKAVRQFLDERDYRMKKCSGIVLLESVICEGMADYGPCDRSCYFFWREEWLERIDE